MIIASLIAEVTCPNEGAKNTAKERLTTSGYTIVEETNVWFKATFYQEIDEEDI